MAENYKLQIVGNLTLSLLVSMNVNQVLQDMHVNYDLDKAASVTSSIDEDIKADSIKNIYYLGKFNKDCQHPRLLLIKFIRSATVPNILSKRVLLSQEFSIKPDRSQAES